jgi:AbrB family looped-hinge helix DNA binding protein
MSTGTMTSKGQITIPIEVRRALGLRAGSRVAFVRRADGVYELRPETGSVRSLRGVIPAPERPVTLKEMDDAIADGASGAGPT